MSSSRSLTQIRVDTERVNPISRFTISTRQAKVYAEKYQRIAVKVALIWSVITYFFGASGDAAWAVSSFFVCLFFQFSKCEDFVGESNKWICELIEKLFTIYFSYRLVWIFRSFATFIQFSSIDISESFKVLKNSQEAVLKNYIERLKSVYDKGTVDEIQKLKSAYAVGQIGKSLYKNIIKVQQFSDTVGLAVLQNSFKSVLSNSDVQSKFFGWLETTNDQMFTDLSSSFNISLDEMIPQAQVVQELQMGLSDSSLASAWGDFVQQASPSFSQLSSKITSKAEVTNELVEMYQSFTNVSVGELEARSLSVLQATTNSFSSLFSSSLYEGFQSIYNLLTNATYGNTPIQRLANVTSSMPLQMCDKIQQAAFKSGNQDLINHFILDDKSNSFNHTCQALSSNFRIFFDDLTKRHQESIAESIADVAAMQPGNVLIPIVEPSVTTKWNTITSYALGITTVDIIVSIIFVLMIWLLRREYQKKKDIEKKIEEMFARRQQRFLR